MASIVCMECKTIFSEYSERCVTCGCPTNRIKEQKEQISQLLLKDKNNNLIKIENLRKTRMRYNDELDVLEQKEKEILELFEHKLVQLKQEKVEKIKIIENQEANRIKHLVSEIETMNNQKLKLNNQLFDEKRNRDNIQLQIDRCSFFKRKEKALLQDELATLNLKIEIIEKDIREIADNINEKEKEKEKDGKSESLKDELNKLTEDKKKEILKERKIALEEINKKIEEIFIDYKWIASYKNSMRKSNKKVAVARNMLNDNNTYYGGIFLKNDVIEEVYSILSKLVVASKDEIINHSAFLSQLDSKVIKEVFSDLVVEDIYMPDRIVDYIEKNHPYFITRIKNNMDDEEYFYALSEDQRRAALDEMRKMFKAHQKEWKRQFAEREREDAERLRNSQIAMGTDTLNYLNNTKPRPKDASVAGRAVAGAVIAGPVGAVIGAISAVDKNNKNRR